MSKPLEVSYLSIITPVCGQAGVLRKLYFYLLFYSHLSIKTKRSIKFRIRNRLKISYLQIVLCKL